MTPQQQTALEALVGRALTAEEVAEITPMVQFRMLQAIANVLSVGRTKVASHFASERGILERFPGGPVAADALLAKLEAYAEAAQPLSRITGRAIRFLRQPEGLDIGSPATQAMLGAITQAGVITADEFAGLRAMALRPDPITDGQVATALGA
jgi:hypothetical protein